MYWVSASVHVHPYERFRPSLNPGNSDAHSAIRVGAAKPAAVSPTQIEIIIGSPGYRPDIAAWGSGDVSIHIPGDALKLSQNSLFKAAAYARAVAESGILGLVLSITGLGG
jgi:hypothetical protein